MIWIYLKILLAVVISAIPFVVKYYIIPKSKEDDKYRNSMTMVASYIPWLNVRLRYARRKLINFFRKLEISKKHRRFFQLSLMLTIMLVQITNANASMSSFRILTEKHLSYGTFEQTSLNVLGLFKVNSGLGWNTVVPSVNLFLMICILTLLRYKYIDKVLTALNSSRKLQIIVFSAILIFVFEPSGSSFMLAEFLYLLLLGAYLYPKLDKEKSMKYYSILAIRKNRVKKS